MEQDMLTTKEVASYLRYHHISIYRMIRDGVFDGVVFKIGGRWRFMKDRIDMLFNL